MKKVKKVNELEYCSIICAFYKGCRCINPKACLTFESELKIGEKEDESSRNIVAYYGFLF